MTSKEQAPDWGWAGRRALVTGGQRGLGSAFTRELLARGVERVFVTARHPVASTDPRIVPLSLDVTDADSVRDLARSADGVSVVFNNAGLTGTPPLSVLDSSLDNVGLVFDTNVFGAIRVAQTVAPLLARHPSSALVDMHSVFSWMGGVGIYGASKAALWSITNSLRVELAAQRTLVVGVHLSFADTGMSARVHNIDKVSPADVADLVLTGIEQGDTEILVDDISRTVKAKLSGPVEDLVFKR